MILAEINTCQWAVIIFGGLGILAFLIAVGRKKAIEQAAADAEFEKQYQAWLKEIDDAKNTYQNLLVSLKRDSSNPDLRETTLQAGRRFLAFCREHRQETLFDEFALMNDINAACAGGPSMAIPPTAILVSPSKPSVEDRLAKLEELRSKGLVTDSEYADRRKQILNEL